MGKEQELPIRKKCVFGYLFVASRLRIAGNATVTSALIQSRSSFPPSSFLPSSTAFSLPSFGSSVKTSTQSGSSVLRFLSTYLSACELCVSESNISFVNVS